MGGTGSTRWRWHTKKQTVEDGWTLSTFALKRDGLIVPDAHTAGSLVWKVRGEVRSSVNYTLRPLGDGTRLLLTLDYVFNTGPHTGERVTEPIVLTSTTPNYGGRRWWFICPLTVNGRACGRRVGKLYLPGGAKWHGCRHCYDLAYTSAQEAHQLDRSASPLLRQLAALDRLMKQYERL